MLWTALASPLAAAVHRLLTAHMVQHLLLMTIAPALILLADPLKALRCALPPWLAQSLARIFRVSPLPQIGKLLASPIVCWFASAAALMGWHIPVVFSLSFESPALHQFEQLTFVLAGFLFWWPVIQPWPAAYTWHRWLLLLYLFLATLPCDILSAYLTFCDRVVYAPYLHAPHADPFSALQDQEFAGALMWTCVTLIYLVPALILTVRLLGRNAPSEWPPNQT